MNADNNDKSMTQSDLAESGAQNKHASTTEILGKIERRTEPDISTAKTLLTGLDSTRTLVNSENTQIVEQLPENQPPHVRESAEGDKTEKLQKLGKYYLLKEISRSPNGVVYKARHEDMHNRIVALKVMPNIEENISSDRISRFKQEINYISSLQHPNIVPVYDIGTTESWLYFTMAFVEGSSLAELIKKNALPVNHAVRIMIKVAKGIHYANQHGIIHRDIKPSNILLDKYTGEPLIVDFGLAKDIKSDVKITQSGVTLGTPPYMPPEQARGKQDMLDSRSDVYSIGATLYELITRKTPFEGDTGMQILMKVLNNTPPRPRKFNPSVSPDLEAVIMKCLSKKQSDRYQNSLSLASDLKKYLSGDWVTARQNTPLNRALNRIYSYRYMIYSILAAFLVISIVIISGYFQSEIENKPAIELREFTDPDKLGHEKRSFKVLRGDSNSEPTKKSFWLHNEIWMNESMEPFAQSYKENNFAGLILTQPVESTDYELEFELEINPSEDEFPNFSFFIQPDGEVGEINPLSDPVMKKGYLLTFGADDNRHWVLYRNGVAQTGDSSFVLGAQTYNVKIHVDSGKFFVEVQDKFRQLFTLKFSDKYPIPLQRGGYFGFISVNTPVVISELKLFKYSPAMSELEKPDRLFNLGLYGEALIDYQEKARRNNELYNLAKFKELLCACKIDEITPEEVEQRLEEIGDLRNSENLANFESVYLTTLYKQRKYQELQQRFFRILSDNNIDVFTKQQVTYSCYHLTMDAFLQILSYNLLNDVLKNKAVSDELRFLNRHFDSSADKDEVFRLILVKRIINGELVLPGPETDFCISMLNMIVNSGFEDEYVKYRSKYTKNLTESIRNKLNTNVVTDSDKRDLADMILRFYFENEQLESSEMRTLLDYVSLFADYRIKGYAANITKIIEMLNQMNFRIGFRLKYWQKKLLTALQKAYVLSKFKVDNQTQPGKSEDR